MKRTLAVGMLALGFAIVPAGEALAQTCAWSARLGPAIPIDELPPGDLVGNSLRVGPGFGVSRLCGQKTGLVYGGTGLILDFGRIQAAYALGDLGAQLELGAGERPPWLHVRASAGLVGAVELGSRNLVQIAGRNAKVPGLGFAIGGGLRLGFPSGAGSWFLDVALLTTLLETEVVGPTGATGSDGFAAMSALPISIGYQFAP